ncbi:MAG TPA: hypothetical protein VMM76_09530, partial [Pirellulaceae bacterium]|nr:hypothetical protein [Pirellulaceae bacterium]
MNDNYYLSRRHLLQGAVGASIAGWTLQGVCRDDATSGGGNLHLAPFRFDVTPPKGHSCCGGWITPVVA